MSDQINVNLIADTLNTKIDLPDGKNQSDVDYIIESYQNGANWYRIYKSGWIEQGGEAVVGEQTITFFKQMANTNYCVNLTAGRASAWAGDYAPQFYSKTVTTMVIKFDAESTNNNWEVKGMGA